MAAPITPYVIPPLPGRVAPGLVSIYGAASIYGLTSFDQNLQFGVISEEYWIPVTYNVGDSVLFKVSDSSTIYYGGVPYFLVEESKILYKENSL